MEVLLVIVVLAVAVLLIVGPLGRRHDGEADTAASRERAELEAAKEARYGEIREAELDYRSGKLSREDWRALDAELRADAIKLLRRIDALDRPEGNPKA